MTAGVTGNLDTRHRYRRQAVLKLSLLTSGLALCTLRRARPSRSSVPRWGRAEPRACRCSRAAERPAPGSGFVAPTASPYRTSRSTISTAFDSRAPPARRRSMTASVPVADGIEARLIEASRTATSGGDGDVERTTGDGRPRRPGRTRLARRGGRRAVLGARVLAVRHRPSARRHAPSHSPIWASRRERVPHRDYHKGGGIYGQDVNLPIPIEEQNNPNATAGCLNRDA
jgi:hypothetical protein